ncbi:hypothetical protein ES703_115375 [subsurface metagenome]
MSEKEWREIITRGKEVKQKTIKINQQPIEKLPPKPKDKLDLVLEGIEGLSEKIDKLKKEKDG